MKNDDLALHHAMRDYAGALSETHTPPHATQVWLRAKHRRKQADLRRAEQPMRIMQRLAVAFIIVIAVWFAQHHGIVATLTAVNTHLLAAATATLAAGLAACGIMFHTSRRAS